MAIMIMKAKSPINGEWYYFIDKYLPFGAAISCAHFQQFSNAIAHLVTFRTKRKNINYLDDFLFAALIKLLCNQQLQMFLNICQQVNFPVSIEKTFWGTTVITFLGFLINTVTQTVSIPIEKVQKAQVLIENILKKRKPTVAQMERLCGFLNFIGRCIIPGRAFTRRIYSVTAGTKKNLKPHHHVKLNKESCLDLEMWKQFVNHASIFCRPFLDYSKTVVADQIDFYTDASGVIGFGGVCGTQWMDGYWPLDFLKQEPSIEFQELYALVAGILLWIQQYANRRVIIFCDNQSVVAMVNSTTSSCKRCMVLIRVLVLHCLKHNVRVFAKIHKY